MTTKIRTLNIEAAETGILIDVDGAPEGINLEYEILPDVIAALVEEALEHRKAPQGCQKVKLTTTTGSFSKEELLRLLDKLNRNSPGLNITVTRDF